jgi:hypothetical protein
LAENIRRAGKAIHNGKTLGIGWPRSTVQKLFWAIRINSGRGAKMQGKLILILAFFVTALANRAVAGTADRVRTPILVELFTSEGCSDCPPADAFLQKLDQQPFPASEIIVLSEHVDYWNHDGWKDPYSSHFFSERQAAYAREFSLASVYTPQMVVDGSSEFVGSNQSAASKAFAKAAHTPKIDIKLSAVSLDSANNLLAHIETSDPGDQKADVCIAIALDHAESPVTAGENAGQKLSHTAVARLVSRVGSLRSNQPFAEEVHLKLPPNLSASKLRIIVFAQQGQRRILGATMQPLNSK